MNEVAASFQTICLKPSLVKVSLWCGATGSDIRARVSG